MVGQGMEDDIASSQRIVKAVDEAQQQPGGYAALLLFNDAAALRALAPAAAVVLGDGNNSFAFRHGGQIFAQGGQGRFKNVRIA